MLVSHFRSESQECIAGFQTFLLPSADENLQCSVCWDNFVLDESVRELNCGHIFHTDCIVPWLEQHATCPVCRKPLTEDAKAHQERQEQEEGEDGGEGGPLGMVVGGAASSAGVANIEIRNSTMNDLSRSANGQVI